MADNTHRPFGAHLDLRPWASIAIIVVPPIAMVLFQFALFQLIAMLPGQNDQAGTFTFAPLQVLAINLSVGIAGLLTVPVVALLARRPWRDVLSYPRPFDLHRLASYLGYALALTLLGNVTLGAFFPGLTPWKGFGVTGTTIALAVIILCTTPLQAAAEELMFRAGTMPAIAARVRSVWLGLGLGIVGSSLLFALTHMSADPWLFSYFTFLGVCTAIMAIRSRGLEAAIAFHVANNTLTATINVFLADGGGLVLDRAVGSGGPYLVVPAMFVVAMTLLVWVWEGTDRNAAPNLVPSGSSNGTAVSNGRGLAEETNL